MDGDADAAKPADKVAENEVEYAFDEQTGKYFKIKREELPGIIMACMSAIYLITSLAFLLWLLFDTWTGRNLLPVSLGYDPKTLASGSFRTPAFVAIGGAMGGAVDGIRSIILWHSEREAYGPRFIWKDLSLPFTGATLGLLAYVTVKTGAGVFTGDFSLDQKGASPVMAAFAIAALAGFSSHQVFRWLDAQANKLFRVVGVAQTIVPDLTGKSVAEATAALKTWKLQLGATNQTPDDAHIGKVIKQSPSPGSEVAGGDSVDITVGIKTPPAAPG
jgi:PASTA domain